MHETIHWLLEGDPSIVYQVHRDLLETNQEDLDVLQKKIAVEGFGKQYLSCQNKDLHWGSKFYSPKWTSSHYTLLDLKTLNVPRTDGIKRCLDDIIEVNKQVDGGINPPGNYNSDVCINGMFLNYASYYGMNENDLKSIVDFIINNHMSDGGFNCRLNRSGAKHSSVHTTICTLEGLASYEKEGYTYRLLELKRIQFLAEEFLLKHRLYKSDKTGEVIHKNMLVLAFPPRWKFNVLRALDYFQSVNHVYDLRMKDALEYLLKKEVNGLWKVQSKHPGQQHFIMEKAGQPSRMVTLMALRILKKYGDEI